MTGNQDSPRASRSLSRLGGPPQQHVVVNSFSARFELSSGV